MIEHVCFYCQSRGDLMVLYKGRVICLDCLVRKYPGLASGLASYLVKSKGVLVR